MSGPRDSYLWNEGSDRSAVFNFVHSLSSWFHKWRRKNFLPLPFHKSKPFFSGLGIRIAGTKARIGQRCSILYVIWAADATYDVRKIFRSDYTTNPNPPFRELGIAISGTKAPIGQRFSILYIIWAANATYDVRKIFRSDHTTNPNPPYRDIGIAMFGTKARIGQRFSILYIVWAPDWTNDVRKIF